MPTVRRKLDGGESRGREQNSVVVEGGEGSVAKTRSPGRLNVAGRGGGREGYGMTKMRGEAGIRRKMKMRAAARKGA